MTETATDTEATEETPPRRMWEAMEFRGFDEERTPEESRTMALAALRESIRRDGFVIEEETLTAGEAQEAYIRSDGAGVVIFEPGVHPAPSGLLVRWSAGARERDVDASGDLIPVSLTYEVPTDMTAAGGVVTLRHNLGRSVTVAAYDVLDEPIGYHIATEIDDLKVTVDIVRNTARLVITPDPDPDEEAVTS